MATITTLLAVGAFLPLIQAINMTFYNPQCGVDYGFGPFYEQLLGATEDPLSTTDFTDFFASNGTLVVLGEVSQGPDEILSTRQTMLPIDGSLQWEHFPNLTFVAWETSTTKTYQLTGILYAIDSGNCAVTYFSTRFTVAKDPITGIANLQPRSRSLFNYEGFIIDRSEDPCVLSYSI